MIKNLCLFFAMLFLLTSCTPISTFPHEGESGNSGSDTFSVTDPQTSSQEATLPTETFSSQTADEYNIQLVHSADGQQITDLLAVDANYTLDINAVVNVSSVERVGMYEYIKHPITDEQREGLLAAYFGDRIDEVQHNTYANRNDWGIENETEFRRFAYSLSYGEMVEETFFIIDHQIRVEHFDSQMLDSVEAAGMNISLDEAYDMCEILLHGATNDLFIPDNVRPFKQHPDTDQGMLWIIYHRVIDGMPITAYNDLKFLVLNDGVTYLHGALYDIAPVELDEKIISIEDAMKSLENNAPRINDPNNFMGFNYLFDNVIPISEITLEYIVVADDSNNYMIIPAWRFLLGDDAESRLIARDRIIAVNAITGELIATRRRATF